MIDEVVSGAKRWHIEQGNVLEVLKEFPAKSVHCVVTSPPYWSLRDYQIPPTVWPNPEHDLAQWTECDHEFAVETIKADVSGGNWTQAVNGRGEAQGDIAEFREVVTGQQERGYCLKGCGSWKGCLGMEPTVKLFVGHLVSIFREVHRVLRDDGTCWVNLGDSYYGSSSKGGSGTPNGKNLPMNGESRNYCRSYRDNSDPTLKVKDLCGVPWRFALAMQDAGWYLRSDIIWRKPNAMPESVTDRPAKSHEYIFLFAKSERYYYDNIAIKQEMAEGSAARYEYGLDSEKKRELREQGIRYHPVGNMKLTTHRNARTVWDINVAKSQEKHYATFPPELPELCISAGTSEVGCCATCGAQHKRVATSSYGEPSWRPSCQCGDDETIPSVVLDPFAGSGTTLLVANRMDRSAVGIEINPSYIEIANRKRRRSAGVPFKQKSPLPGQKELFGDESETTG